MAFSAARMDRQVRREAKQLAREARRGLRRHRDRLPGSIAEGMSARLEAVVTAAETGDGDALRANMVVLDELVDEHLSFARKSTMREYAESIGMAVMIALLLRGFVIEAFKIPSGSMVPTMQIGDHIFVNKFLYGMRVPFTDKKIFDWRKPRRGEVVVFVYPCERDKDFIKRIVALPGDHVEIRCDTVYVNGKAVQQTLDDKSACSYWDYEEQGEMIAPGVGKRARDDSLLCPDARLDDPWASCRCSRWIEHHGDAVYATYYDPVRPKQRDIPGPHDFPDEFDPLAAGEPQGGDVHPAQLPGRRRAGAHVRADPRGRGPAGRGPRKGGAGPVSARVGVRGAAGPYLRHGRQPRPVERLADLGPGADREHQGQGAVRLVVDAALARRRPAVAADGQAGQLGSRRPHAGARARARQSRRRGRPAA